MTDRKCNRCGEDYPAIHGGRLQLGRRDPAIGADLCPGCFDEMVEAYEKEAGDS